MGPGVAGVTGGQGPKRLGRVLGLSDVLGRIYTGIYIYR